MKIQPLTPIHRLRFLALLEGTSLVVLVFVAVPLKYLFQQPSLVQILGPVHGILFILFIIDALRTGIEESWSFQKTTWKLLLACFIPFGTFYIDRIILRELNTSNRKA